MGATLAQQTPVRRIGREPTLQFHASVDIARPVDDAFRILCGIDQVKRDPRSLVPLLEKTSEGPYGVGTTFHEEVRVLPFARANVRSIITRYDPPNVLEYRFSWQLLGMHLAGELSYVLTPTRDGGTHLDQFQTLRPFGVLRPFRGSIERSFARRIAQRAQNLKSWIEASPA